VLKLVALLQHHTSNFAVASGITHHAKAPGCQKVNQALLEENVCLRAKFHRNQFRTYKVILKTVWQTRN